ncbi:DNA-binding LytR/AlgR family response regulator [Duganella sp. 1411]|uniref:LytR/AlgR family response regulator transcription factor n=1 Tax=Duganella sp. 1411 TaxID=2806572 RepID=UPI001AE30297|nr:LytTR family DNA-binding domain-containing protein [Duganella sp. 1411]MBP1202611.1 DNA-binding LytR/AlgR family response regulator [Duganella sp. 1411]
MRHDGAPDAAFEREPDIDTFHALIADDEAHLRDYLEGQLETVWPELRVVAKAANGLEALRLIDEQAPDVVFLDIRMPGMTGLDVAARLLEAPKPPHIVFVTAFDQYAVAAFEHSAVDYLLKPASLERLTKTVGKLKAALQARREEVAPAGGVTAAALQALLAQLGGAAPSVPVAAAAPLQWIRAAHGDQTRLIAVDEVIYFQSNDKYTSVFLADGESLIRTPISKLREQLDERHFWQIHRSVIVAARHVAGTRQDFRGRLMVQLKGRAEQLVVSRNYVDLFRQM